MEPQEPSFAKVYHPEESASPQRVGRRTGLVTATAMLAACMGLLLVVSVRNLQASFDKMYRDERNGPIEAAKLAAKLAATARPTVVSSGNPIHGKELFF